MYDPIAYRRKLLARLVQIAGAGSAALAAMSAPSCGARTGLGVSAKTSAAGTGGHGVSSTTGLGGVGGLGTGGVGGFGGEGFGGAIVGSTTTASVTVSVGSGPPDGSLEEGTACITEPPGGCPSAGAASGPLFIPLENVCWTLVTVVNGPMIENGACCYEVEVKPFPCYVGRTFFVDEGIVKAELRAGRTWREGPAPDVSSLPPATRRALGDAWARDGLFEHASVASLSRFAMQLLALGAPADLVRDTLAAATDEVRHAELCFALASAYLGESVEPAVLPIPAPITIEPDLAAIASELAMEGCIGETVATVQAIDALAETTDPAVREALVVTVDDETRHAELAWRFVAWAIDRGGDAVREAVFEAFAGFRPAAPRAEPLEGVDLALYAAHGRQRAKDGRAIAEQAMADIIRPAMCALLSRRLAA